MKINKETVQRALVAAGARSLNAAISTRQLAELIPIPAATRRKWGMLAAVHGLEIQLGKRAEHDLSDLAHAVDEKHVWYFTYNTTFRLAPSYIEHLKEKEQNHARLRNHR